MKGLTVRITEEMHAQLKLLMIVTGDTVQNYITNLIEQDFQKKNMTGFMKDARSCYIKEKPFGETRNDEEL